MIRFEQVRLSYDGETPVLEDVDLEIGPGVNLVLGPNGSGKSSLLRVAAGVQRPDLGTVSVDGLDLWREEVEARRSLAYVPDHPDLTPYASVAEILRLVCRVRGEPEREGRERLARLGIDGLARRSVRELSAGQRRRILIAAARIGSPRHLLLDEPLEDLDREGRADVVRWIADARGRGHVVALATHDLETLGPLADRVVAVARGRVRAIRELPLEPSLRAAALAEAAGGANGPPPV